MNERIRQLAEQAGATVDKGTHPLTGVVDGLFMGPNEVEKFAELIVQKCVSIVAKRKDQAIDDEWNVDEAMSVAEMDLLEHFGVEE